MKPIVVLYHANCPDGFGAAWAAWKKFKDRADYIPVVYQTSPPKGLKNKSIYIVDFSYPAATLRKLLKTNKNVTVIDHHLSAKQNVRNLPSHSFNLNHSGAVLAWRYFHPRKPLPTLLKYVEDVDLWIFRLPHSEEINSFIFGHKFNFNYWNNFCREIETAAGRKKYALAGETINQFVNVIVEETVKKSYLVEFFNRKVLAVNFSNRHFHSQIGHALCSAKPPMSIVWWLSGNELHVSLRSKGKYNVAKIAEHFPGGGGQRNAAGFTILFNNRFPWKVLKQNS